MTYIYPARIALSCCDAAHLIAALGAHFVAWPRCMNIQAGPPYVELTGACRSGRHREGPFITARAAGLGGLLCMAVGSFRRFLMVHLRVAGRRDLRLAERTLGGCVSSCSLSRMAEIAWISAIDGWPSRVSSASPARAR